jgi:hypothetical protein
MATPSAKRKQRPAARLASRNNGAGAWPQALRSAEARLAREWRGLKREMAAAYLTHVLGPRLARLDRIRREAQALHDRYRRELPPAAQAALDEAHDQQLNMLSVAHRHLKQA